MKIRPTTYTFDASAKTIDCASFTSLEAIQLITNVTDGVIIYNFADPAKGGSLASTTLTLTYDTTSMADTDKLQILVEDGTATQPVSASSLPLPTGASTSAKQDTGNTSLATIAGAVAGTEVQVDVLTMPSVTGTVTANAGTNLNTSALALETGGNLASIKTNTDKIPALGQALASASVPVILPAATITTLTPPAAITNFANETGGNLAAIKAKTDNIPALGQALAASSVPVVLTAAQITTLTPPAAITGFATSAKQDTGNTSVASIDTKTPALGQAVMASSSPVVIASNQTALPVAGDVASAGTDSGNPLKIGGLFSTTPATLTDGQRGNIQLSNRGSMHVELKSGVTSMQNGNGLLTQGNVANDGTDAGNPIKIGGKASSSAPTDVAANDRVDAYFDLKGRQAVFTDVAIPAGTNAIGKMLPPDVDVTAHTNYARKYYTSAGAATDGIIWSPAAGKRWHITSLIFQTSADATITFEDDKAGGDDPVLKGEFKAGSGLALTFDEKYPFASGEDAADFTVTSSAGNIYVSVVGFEI